MSAPVNFRWFDRYGQSKGSHAPQMAYCRNIMIESRPFAEPFAGVVMLGLLSPRR